MNSKEEALQDLSALAESVNENYFKYYERLKNYINTIHQALTTPTSDEIVKEFGLYVQNQNLRYIKDLKVFVSAFYKIGFNEKKRHVYGIDKLPIKLQYLFTAFFMNEVK